MFITLEIQNNLMRMLNQPTLQMREPRPREGAHAPIHTACKWRTQHLIYARALLFSLPLLSVHTWWGAAYWLWLNLGCRAPLSMPV